MARSDTLHDSSAVPVRRLPLHFSLSRARNLVLAPGVRQSIAVWGLTRVLFLLLTYFGVILFGKVFQSPHPGMLHSFLPAWGNRWDAVWYTDIARRGYAWKKAVGTSPAAFFPLYPLLIRAGVILSGRSYALVALVISNLSFLAALIYLWRLAAWELGREVAGRTVLYIAVFPTALFFFAGYTESLFLLLTVACFFHLRRGDWVTAGLFGALASGTRVTGVLLLIPLVYEYAHCHNFSLRRIEWRALSILLVPAGLLAFMLYLHLAVGNALAFTQDQAGWQKIFTLRLWAGTLESIRQILIVQPQASFFQAHNIINLGIGSLFFVLSIYAARRLAPSYGLYLAAFWLVTLSSPALAGGYPVPLISLSRYVVTLFPAFMILAVLGRNRSVHDAYLVIGAGLLSLFTVQFINGGWII